MVDTVTSVQDVHVCIESFTTFSSQATILYDKVYALASNGWYPTATNPILGIPDYSDYIVIIKRSFEQLNLFFELYL